MRALLLPVVLLTGCAGANGIAQTKQDSYFSCAGVTLETAEQNLALEGWPIGEKGSKSITTEYRPMQLAKGTELIFFHGDRYSVKLERPGQYSAKLLVATEADDSGVRFHIFQTVETEVTKEKREGKVERIIEAQIDHGPTRGQLNRYRRAVCGGKGYFSG